MTSESTTTLTIGTDYRSARRLTSLFCAVGLGWSAAQFELTSVSLGSVGVIDVTNGSIPLILACAIVYMTIKSIIGFGMQPKEVRRWSLAQLDCKLCWFLVRATLLMLAAGGLHRSVDTFISRIGWYASHIVQLVLADLCRNDGNDSCIRSQK